MEKSKVYFTADISSNGLVKIYEALGCDLKDRIAVKISTGEPGGHNFLDPNLIKALIENIDGVIVECCTAYEGKRGKASDHWKTIKEHGFLDIASCDIMDEEGELKIPIEGGKHLKGYNIVGDHIKNYNSMLVLSHFKGHAMGGFGGALKNMSIGVASRTGKAWIHSWGNSIDMGKFWNYSDNQDAFLESMAEACKSVIDYFGEENMAYINVANKLSIDCDCDNNPRDPEMNDIGIFASLDPVALDQCCYDTIMNSSDKGKDSLVKRMKEKNAIHILEESSRLGLGNCEYNVINID